MLDSPHRVHVSGRDPAEPAVALALPALILVAALAAGVVAQGGYYRPGRLLLTAGVVLAVLVARPWRHGTGRSMPLAAAVLAIWIMVRAVATGTYEVPLAAVATLGTVVAVVAVVRRCDPAERERVAVAALGIGVLVAVTAWLGVALRLPSFAVLVEHRLWRGASTLTYPNAAAALLVPLALLAIGLLVARPGSPVRAATAYLLLVGVGAALSRAGVIALLAGLVLLAVLAGVRATGWHVAGPAVGAVVAVGALAPSFPAGGPPRPLLAVAGLVIGAAVAVGSSALVGRWRAAALVGSTLAVVAVVASQRGTGFLGSVLASRGNLDSSGRRGAWQAAAELIAAQPWAGTGMGRAGFLWTTADGNGQIAVYAHNEYLQIVAELGVIGLVALLALFAAVAVTVHRGRATPHRPGIWAGAAAALVALAVHSGFDFLWHIAVLPLVAGLLIGLAAPSTSEEPISAVSLGEE